MTTRSLNPHPNDWCVTQCSCGGLTLRLGTFQMEFTPEEFARLDRLVSSAMRQFEVQPSDALVFCPESTTH